MRRLSDRFAEAAEACRDMPALRAILADVTLDLGFHYFALLDLEHGRPSLGWIDEPPLSDRSANRDLPQTLARLRHTSHPSQELQMKLVELIARTAAALAIPALMGARGASFSAFSFYVLVATPILSLATASDRAQHRLTPLEALWHVPENFMWLILLGGSAFGLTSLITHCGRLSGL